MEVGAILARRGRPPKYTNPKMVHIYMSSEDLEEFDRQRGKLSRADYLSILIRSKGKNIGVVLRENEELKRQIKKLEMKVIAYSKKIQKYENMLRALKETKIDDKKKNLEIVEQIKNELTKLVELKNKRSKELNPHRIEELNREIKKTSKKCNHFLEKTQVDKTEFWRLVNSGNIEEAIKLLTR
ncbi:hypothetical protein EP1X_08995 [Thermococcus sp. EP1]|uniref:hypothetical protein n=1 Tax=Thermococcus sp. EP1 TaxID=1591054 RepID=UPI0006D9A0F5|nr:hypothetical protein [Thermococcus sp. EP1]KPU62396.1 hypothetical protein EP1X_08995 [Thermococcus sp. EP1]